MLYSNRSACHLQNGDHESAVKDAALLTRMNPTFAKGWGRLGAAHYATGQYEEAAPAYKKAAELDPSVADYASQHRLAAEKVVQGQGVAGEDARKKFYVEKHKRQGLEEFKKENYVAAVRYFTQALEVDPLSHILFSNRSAAQCKVALMPCTSYKNMPQVYQLALDDALMCVQLEPTWSKGYAREGAALAGLLRYDEAEAAYKSGLKFSPDDKYCQEGLAAVLQTQKDIADDAAKHAAKQEKNKETDKVVAANPDQAPLPDTKIPSVFCHKCGKEGHFATNCREKIITGVVGGGYAHGYDTCRYCGEMGHSKRDCPARIGKEETERQMRAHRSMTGDMERESKRRRID